ncbi:MAG TPA: serine/threonine protein kinase [Candidatus Melainabacteria bacterium]|nr:serine/threonine protein kinase [Candidatus Melainabacteria bacterium]HIN63082.1 serine/threonine protein kinase [Candidatus Obscuribacterales bacterium]
MAEGAKKAQKKRCPKCHREFPLQSVICDADSTLLMLVQEDTLLNAVLAEKYRVLHEVGRGGMSVVYKGVQEFVDREVAIKILQSQLVSDPTSVKRFQQEAQAASLLKHENIIKMYDFGIHDGRPYLVMDFLVGESLSDIIRRDNQVECERAIRIFIQATDALAHAHRHGVIHRDLKSSNIMLVDEDGKADVAKVVDFGIAKLLPNSGRQSQNLTQTGEIFGSPIYMSPEQCMGHILDARSDIYSMGTMVYESLTGYPALMGKTIVETMEMQVRETPKPFAEIRPDLQLPKEVETIVFRALEKKPDNRYQSMEEFRDALVHVGKILANKKPAAPRSTVTNIPPAERGGQDLSKARINAGADSMRLKDAPSSVHTKSLQGQTGTQIKDKTGSVPIVDRANLPAKPFYESPKMIIILVLVLILVTAGGFVAMQMTGTRF